MKKKSIFSQIKKGQRVWDLGYGRGIVRKKLKTRVHIYIQYDKKVHIYDVAHVNRFISIGWHIRGGLNG